MYNLSIHRTFVAKHFLIGGDWGPENELHPHQYQLEIRVRGSALNEHGYLLDIVDLTEHLDALVSRFEGNTLNEFPEFQGLNPSIENFSRIAVDALAPRLTDPNLEQLTVRLYEDDIGWASHTRDL